MTDALPLAGIRVVEFVHMVMGPTCGLVLADLGADVIKVEPIPDGDNTRRLTGSGAGYSPTYNRNKRSLAVDLKSPEGMEIVRRLLATADVVTENFRPGAMDKLGLGYDAVHAINPRIVYVSLKGFLPGPYDHRTALDEVVQMMGGLAYMTGPEGRPLRAGASVNDVMGGMFAAYGILAALIERGRTGRGQYVQSALFENTVFLVAQHMMQALVTGRPAAPMPTACRRGRSTTCSRRRTASRCSSASSPIRSGRRSARRSAWRNSSPTRASSGTPSACTRASASCRRSARGWPA